MTSPTFILPTTTISLPSDLTSTFIAYTITDGDDICAGGYPLPRWWETEAEAAKVMGDMCWHPRRFAGPFRVEAVDVVCTKYGTTLSVKRIAA